MMAMSVTSRHGIETAESIQLIFWRRGYHQLILHFVYERIRVSPKITELHYGTLSKTLDLEKISQHIDHRKCYQLSLTDNCRHIITLSVHLCVHVQYNKLDAACQTDSSVAAESCFHQRCVGEISCNIYVTV